VLVRSVEVLDRPDGVPCGGFSRYPWVGSVVASSDGMGNGHIPYHAYPWIGEGQAPSGKPRLGSRRSFEQNTYFWNDDDGTMRVAQVTITSSGASGLGRCDVLVVVWTLDRKLMVDQRSPCVPIAA
jgi:hypothetical protein